MWWDGELLQVKHEKRIMWLGELVYSPECCLRFQGAFVSEHGAGFLFASSGRSREFLFIRWLHVLSLTFSSTSLSFVPSPIRVNWLLADVCRHCPLICAADVTVTVYCCLCLWDPWWGQCGVPPGHRYLPCEISLTLSPKSLKTTPSIFI